jgi:hypothetical protein
MARPRYQLILLLALVVPVSAHAAAPLPPTGAPQNPNMAINPNSNIHDDTWMTDTYDRAGPLGTNLQTQQGFYPPSLCGSLAFDTAGRIVSICPSTISAPVARIIDPKTLQVLGSYTMPNAPDPPGTKAYQNFTGGGYFYLDARNRVWSATKTSHLFVLAEQAGGAGFDKVGDYDLTGVLTSDERVTSALPDFQGRIWFVSKKDGKVGILDTKTSRIVVKTINEEIENSFAVDRHAVYIVSDKRMYRFSVRNGAPHVDWRSTYRNSGIVKPSQVDAGSGTTPTILRGGFVAITDNADPMNVVVYRTAIRLGKGRRRVFCQVPVFDKGASATENSLLGTGRSLVVENNYGYTDPFAPDLTTPLTTPGFARVDINRKGTGCRKVWTNTTDASPTVVPKLSTKTGLIYAYDYQNDSSGSPAWMWTGIDVRTGQNVFRKTASSQSLTGNNNYAGLALGPDGTAYLGTIGGMEALRDGG